MVKSVILDSLSNKVIICFLAILLGTEIISNENILVIRPMKLEYKVLEKGIYQYFGNNYNIISAVNCKTSSCLASNIKKHSPVAIIAMEKETIS